MSAVRATLAALSRHDDLAMKHNNQMISATTIFSCFISHRNIEQIKKERFTLQRIVTTFHGAQTHNVSNTQRTFPFTVAVLFVERGRARTGYETVPLSGIFCCCYCSPIMDDGVIEPFVHLRKLSKMYAHAMYFPFTSQHFPL
jgi:hypothetical protein